MLSTSTTGTYASAGNVQSQPLFARLEYPFSRYCADRWGNIYQHKNSGDHKPLKPRSRNPKKGDHRQILDLTLDYRGPDNKPLRQTQQVAYWMLYAWHGAPKGNKEASHLDGNRENNFLTNLAWETPEINRKRRYANGQYSGVNNPRHRFTEGQVRFLRYVYEVSRWTIDEIVRAYLLPEATVRRVVTRTTYKNVFDDPFYTLSPLDHHRTGHPDYPNSYLQG